MNPTDIPIRIGSTWRNRYLHEGGPSTTPQLPNQFTVLGVQTLATEWPVTQFLAEFEELPLA